jgi:peptidoglycan/LPS O-acetylase OafA/YrhL
MRTLLPPSPHPLHIAPISPTQPNSTDALLVLRALACLMVVAIHCNPPRQSIVIEGVDFSWLIFSHGPVAVWIFFCLSGYLMGKAFYSGRYDLNWPGVVNFWRNRALRIMPLYSFSILLLSIFVYPEVLKPGNWAVLLHLFTFTYNPHPIELPPIPFNVVFWSISTEFQFYLLVPAIYAISKRYLSKQRHIFLAILTTILTIFSLKFAIWTALHQQIADHQEYGFSYLYVPLVTNLDIFLVGFLMNLLLRTVQKPSDFCHETPAKTARIEIFTARFYKLLAVSLMILLYLFSAHHIYSQELFGVQRTANGVRTATSVFVLQPVTALVTAYFIFAFERHGFTHAPAKLSPEIMIQNPYRLLEVFGHLSYGVYLWHVPILQKISPIFTSPIPIEAFYLRLQSTLFLSLLLATVTYYVIEAPATRWKSYRYPQSAGLENSDQ